jgi:2-polyprenyl-3-methyl-5-hydroxy-6-metoxy-1,4-benzoquinol methylase
MKTMECPICTGKDYSVFFRRKDTVVQQQFLMKTRTQAQRIKRGDIELAFCRNCSMIWNVAFDPQLLEYSSPYEASQTSSPAFRRYLSNVARRLVRKYDLHRKRVIELGSGDGEFLKLLCELGQNRGTGFEPSWRASQRIGPRGMIRIVPHYYSHRYSDVPADIICCRHVLEHIQDPLSFLRGLVSSETHDPVYFFEVPDFSWSLLKSAFWDVYYEHFTYFSSTSLRFLFSVNGFRVLQIRNGFYGQYLLLEAVYAHGRKRGVFDSCSRASEEVKALSGMTRAFATRYRQFVRQARQELNRVQGEQRVAIWGAGAKAVTFLNILEVQPDEIESVVDINPRKWGSYIPGTGQRIVSPSSLRDTRPETILVMNPAYVREIKKTLREMDITARLQLLGGRSK